MSDHIETVVSDSCSVTSSQNGGAGGKGSFQFGGVEGDSDVAGAFDGDWRLRRISRAPFEVTRLKQILPDALDEEVGAQRAGEMNVGCLVGGDFLRGQRADEAIRLVEREFAWKVDHGLKDDLMFRGRSVI